MPAKNHTIFYFLFHRAAFIVLTVILQIVTLILVVWDFQNTSVYFYFFSVALSLTFVLYIVNNRSNPAYKIAWITAILLFPVFGGLFYLLFGGNRLSSKSKKSLRRNEKLIISAFDKECYRGETGLQQSKYIRDYTFYPLYDNTYAEYFPNGETKYEYLTEELKKARFFIFLEYFIIQEGKMWNSILEILAQKASEGVDVRIIYDDFGCLMKLPSNYNRKLRRMGIKCCVFNPIVPLLYARLNNRDHRKILVIDGHTGFTGGVNLADEYINETSRFGYWKDSAIMLKGKGVYSLTVMFLSMWDFLTGVHDDFEKYACPCNYIPPMKNIDNSDCSQLSRNINNSDYTQLARNSYNSNYVQPIKNTGNLGFVQPYADSPLDFESVGENVYLNLINAAQKYIYITTPYLIIDNELTTALTLAAKKGVDVKIIMPHIPDKPFIFTVSQAYYNVLVEAGVKIYEYIPGFMHSKTFISDDTWSIVGSINLDYRSLYLHFECAVWLYNTPCLVDIKADFKDTLEKCKEITLEDCRKQNVFKKLLQSVLRLFSPLM